MCARGVTWGTPLADAGGMGFFDKMKQAVGIGGAKVDIEMTDSAVPLGGFARGRVVLRGGKSEQKCSGIEARLERVTRVRVEVDGKMQDKDDVENIQSEKLAEYQFSISPESEMSFDFAFRVPREGGPGTRIKYRLYATADIAGAIDPSKTIELAVTDAAPIAAGAGDVPQLLQTVATLRRQGGEHAAEIEAMLRQVIALDGKNAQGLRQLAEVVGWRNDAEAVPFWHAYLQLVPADVDAWEELARNAERRGANTEALQTYDHALTLAPQNSGIHGQRARVLEALDRIGDAIAAYEAASRGDSPDDDYAISRAKLLARQGRGQEAEVELCAIGERCATYRLDDVLTALDELGARQHEERLFARALERFRGDELPVHELHAKRLFKRGEYARSLEAVDRALARNSDSPWVAANLMALKGQSLEHLDRRADAKAAYKRALELDKDNWDAKSRLKAL